MRIPFCQLLIQTDIEGILRIRSLELTEALNSHAFLKMDCLLEEDARERAVAYTSMDSQVEIYREGTILFFGYLYSVKTGKEHGKWELSLTYVSASFEMDVTRRSRVFYRQKDRYLDVIGKVSALYPGSQIQDKASGETPCPGAFLQYEETDWEFLKRLASHFSAFLIPDTSSRLNRIYFGLPDIDNGKALWDKDFEILQDMDAFYRLGKGMKQEHTAWRIRSPLILRMGENLIFNGIACTVAGIRIFSQKGEILQEYTLRRRDGLVIRQEFNYEILGISLPVTVTSRKDNVVQVEFDVNQPYPSEEPSLFFTYGIESSSFYCMPEVGSRAHVYFPDRNDWNAVAVHALNPGDGAGRNPDNKRFSSPDGAAMQLNPASYSFQSDTGGAVRMIMGTDGNVSITGTDISFSAGSSITIGSGEENTPKILFGSKGDQLFQTGSSSVALESDFILVADKAKLKAESGDMSVQAEAIRQEVTAGDSALMDAYNQPAGSGGQASGGGTSGSSGQQQEEKPQWEWNFFEKNKFKHENKTPANWLDKEGTEDDYKWTLYDNDPENKSKIDKYRYNTSIGEISASGSVFDESKSDGDSKRSGLLYGSYTSTPGAWKAYANAYAGLTEKNKKPGFGAQAGASFSMYELQGEGGIGSEDYNVHAGGSVAVLKAEAKADAVAGFNEKGQLQLGVAGEAGFYKLEGSLSGGVTFAGARADAKLTGRIGFGLEGQAGFIDGKFKVKLGVCFIFGGSLEFEVDISKWLP